MIKQYMSIKDAYPDAILLYRMGDFFEMFFEDAEKASRALEITLTSRNKHDDQPIPMCGVPVRAVQGYIARLLENGFKVAVCDQVEDPSQAKGIVKREVVRVVTPGMIIEDELLEARSGNYILAFNPREDRYGLASLDISTGRFRLTETPDGQRAVDEALRIAPREILLPADRSEDAAVRSLRQRLSQAAVALQEPRLFDAARARDQLLRLFQTHSLEGFGCASLKAGIGAAGALVDYLQETQKQAVRHFDGIETYGIDGYLWIDERSCRNLELFVNLQNGTRRGTLLGVLDQTVTAMGARLLREWLRYPLLDAAAIMQRQDAVGEALQQTALREALRTALAGVYDLERLTSKVALGRANARDLLAVKQSLQALPEVWEALGDLQAAAYCRQVPQEGLNQLAQRLEDALREDAPPVLNEGGLIKPGYDAELDELIRLSRDGKGWLAQLEAREREATGIGSLKVRYNKVFGYYLEVPKSKADEVPGHYIRKQTLVNAERYITDELKTFEAKVLNAEERRFALEARLFEELRAAAAAHHPRLQATARFLAEVDGLLALAEVAARQRYTRPAINAEGRIDIEEGRHPVIEKLIAGERFVPNSVFLDDATQQLLIITGPNMAGKSTILRQVALAVIMTQMGAFVPAARASMALVDRIFTRVGALDNLSQGQSTFLVEMQETADILHNATARSLVILDEIGRGTSTYDGLSIAWAVAEYLHELRGAGVKTLFATHYHELTQLAETFPRIRNFNIAVKEWNDEVIFLHKLVEGGTNRSYGIQVSRLAGIPAAVVERAKAILADIERDGHPQHAAAPDSGRRGKESGHVQLELFQKATQALIDQLRRLDIARTTPMDALNLLNQLHEKSRMIK